MASREKCSRMRSLTADPNQDRHRFAASLGVKYSGSRLIGANQ